MPSQTISTIQISGRRIIIKDAMIMLDRGKKDPEWPWVDVSPGSYQVQLDSDGAQTTLFRVIKEKVKEDSKELIGTVDVDHGAVATCDYDSMISAIEENPEEYADWTCDELEENVDMEETGTLSFCDVRYIFADTGVGDGCFQTYKLICNEEVIGIETVCASQ